MGKIIDLTGQKFGHLTVIKDTGERKDRQVIWECECDCEKHPHIKVRGASLRKGNTTSCGCAKKGVNIIDLTGQQYGNLIVLKQHGKANDGHIIWECECQCENKTICYKTSNQLRRKNTFPSCGCKVHELISESAKQRYNDLTNQKFGMLIALEKVGTTGQSVLWRCHCNNCGNDNFITTAHHLTSGNTKSCGCLKSVGEKIIQKLLIDNQILFIKEKTFPDLTYSDSKKSFPRYDFYLPEFNRLIEYDGIQHFQKSNETWDKQISLEERQLRDKIKNQWALEHNIPLVRIPYWERDNITLEMIMGDQYLIKRDT